MKPELHRSSCQCAAADSCNGACTSTLSDPANCGMCSHPCGANESCSNGVCKPMCPMPQTSCNGACVDTKSDPKNCGMCGHPARPERRASPHLHLRPGPRAVQRPLPQDVERSEQLRHVRPRVRRRQALQRRRVHRPVQPESGAVQRRVLRQVRRQPELRRLRHGVQRGFLVQQRRLHLPQARQAVQRPVRRHQHQRANCGMCGSLHPGQFCAGATASPCAIRAPPSARAGAST